MIINKVLLIIKNEIVRVFCRKC